MITIANPNADDRDLAAYGRLLRELARYCVTPARIDKPLLSTEFDVYIWRAGLNQFRRIGVRPNYRAADVLIRQHIRRRLRRRYVRPAPRPIAYCFECNARRRLRGGICRDCEQFAEL